MSSRTEAVGVGRMIGLGSLLSYLYCMAASTALVDTPLFGGALYLSGQTAMLFFTTFGQEARGLFSGRMKRWRIALLAVLLISVLALVLIYPQRLSDERVWLLFAVIAAMLLRALVCRAAVRLSARGALGETGFAAMMACGHAFPAAALLWVLLSRLASSAAWPLMGGYALCDVAALWFEFRARQDERGMRSRGESLDVAAQLRDALKGAKALRAYEALVSLIVMALEITTVMCFATVSRFAEHLLAALMICAGVGFAAYALSEGLLQRRQRRRRQLSDPTNVLLLGLVLWFYGLNNLRGLQAADIRRVTTYLNLGFITAGCCLCLSAVGWLEKSMRTVARFAAGREPEGFDRMRASLLDVSALAGQVLSLGLMTLLIFTEAAQSGSLRARIQPLLILPALILVVMSLASLLRFPLYGRTMGKLSRLERVRAGGGQNAALQQELQHIVTDSRDRPFFGRIARWLIRRLYPHRLIGVEHIRQDDEDPIVFLCNHSELYGALVGVANMPVPCRLWVISHMVSDLDEVSAYLYKYTFSRQRWIPRRLRMPVSRLLGRLSIWGMSQLGGIPVWRDKPILLKRTFRATVEAMLAGDNVLIFPENPDATPEGYRREGIGELFTGFAMIGQLYHQRTGKRCRFLPMLAHRERRTITFGEEIVFDPEAPAQEEILRVAEACHRWMEDTWDREEQALHEPRPRRTGRGAKAERD